MRYSDYATHLQAVMRMIVALLIMIHGTQKLFGYPEGDAIAFEKIATLYGVAGLVEFLGGFLVLIGYATRPISFILSGEMALIYLKANLSEGPWPMLNGGEVSLIYCIILLFLSSAGAGKFSIDTSQGYD